MIQSEIIIKSAIFNAKVKTYIFFVVLFFLISSIIGIILIPFWILGLGQWLSGKYFNTLSCEISNKNLKFSKGILLHIEKTIPLENIQDLSFIGGPVLRYFGLTLIKIETAGGGGGAHHQNSMSMLGIDDAVNFKLAILSERENVIKEKYSLSKPPESSNTNNQLLIDIKNELIEIKHNLKNK